MNRFNKMSQGKTNSVVDWLGDIPSSWELIRLRFLCCIGTGSKDTVDNVINGKYPFFVRSDNVEKIDEFTHDEEAVMTAGDGVGVGRVFHYYKGKFAAHQRVYVFTKFNNCKAKFIYYYLKSNLAFEVLKGNAKSTVDSLRRPMLANFLVSLPSFNEQESIIRFLDDKTSEIDSLIAAKKKLVDLLEEQRQAIITEAVTKGLDPNVKMKDSDVEWIGEIPEHWRVMKIKRLTKIGRGASPRPIDDPKYFDENGEYAWVRISDVTRSGMYLKSTEQRLSNIGANLSVKLQPGSLFLSIAASVGKPCITSIKCCIHDGFVYFLNYKENIKFLYYIFDSGEPYKGLGKLGTQLNLNRDTVGMIAIPVPPLSEQNKIVECIDKRVESLNKLINSINEQIIKLQEYRQSLIYEAVTGKIDVQDYKKEKALS